MLGFPLPSSALKMWTHKHDPQRGQQAVLDSYGYLFLSLSLFYVKEEKMISPPFHSELVVCVEGAHQV